jgi:twitching motility protein PilI
MAKRLSLREFQEGLVRRFAEARTGDRRSLLAVHAGKENWLINLTDSGEILPVPPLAPVPLTQEWFRGIANVRGTLFSVVDFSALHRGPLTAPAGTARLLLIGVRHGTNCALLVSRTAGLRSTEDFQPDDTAPKDERPWVGGHLRDVHDRPWLKLDAARLLTHRGFLDAGID